MASSTPEHEAEHEGAIDLGTPFNRDAPADVGLLHARFVRYPGCQQLQLWLPLSGRDIYGQLQVCDERGRVIAAASVSQRLNGSVQLLFDTLRWPPGRLTLEIAHSAGWCHVLPLHKLRDDEEPAPPPAAPPPAEPARPIVYRDGFGRVLPDVDLQMRERAQADLLARFTRRVVYQGYVRAGTFTYVEGEVRIAFSQEMGAGSCKAVLDVPPERTWEAATGTALTRRDEIVQFVAEEARRYVGGTRAEIRGDWISVF